jgi:hypothetical protein
MRLSLSLSSGAVQTLVKNAVELKLSRLSPRRDSQSSYEGERNRNLESGGRFLQEFLKRAQGGRKSLLH